MFCWFKRHRVDTQPLPVVATDKIDALKVLKEARNRREEAERLNQAITATAEELKSKRNDNHFYESFITILRME